MLELALKKLNGGAKEPVGKILMPNATKESDNIVEESLTEQDHSVSYVVDVAQTVGVGLNHDTDKAEIEAAPQKPP